MGISTGAAILGSAAIGAMAGDKGGGSSQSTTSASSAPWEGADMYLRDLFARGYNTMKGNDPQSANTMQAQELQRQRALSGSPLTQAAQGQNLATIRGDYTDLSKNPAAQSAMDMARSKINSQFSGDNYGNSANQEWLSKGLLNAAAPFYESERQRQVGATALAPSLANQDYFDIGQLGQVGAAQEQAPWAPLQRMQGVLAASQGGQSSSSTQNPYFTNPLATGLGIGIGGLSLYNGLNQSGLLGGVQAQQQQPFYTGFGMQGDYQYG